MLFYLSYVQFMVLYYVDKHQHTCLSSRAVQMTSQALQHWLLAQLECQRLKCSSTIDESLKRRRRSRPVLASSREVYVSIGISSLS